MPAQLPFHRSICQLYGITCPGKVLQLCRYCEFKQRNGIIVIIFPKKCKTNTTKSTRKHCSFVAVDTARSDSCSLGNCFGLVMPATVTASLASTYTHQINHANYTIVPHSTYEMLFPIGSFPKTIQRRALLVIYDYYITSPKINNNQEFRPDYSSEILNHWFR